MFQFSTLNAQAAGSNKSFAPSINLRGVTTLNVVISIFSAVRTSKLTSYRCIRAHCDEIEFIEIAVVCDVTPCSLRDISDVSQECASSIFRVTFIPQPLVF